MKNRYKRKRIIFIGSILLISILALFFIIFNFRDNIVFFYSPSELRNSEILAKIHDKRIRVGGIVAQGSVKKTDGLTVEFLISDFNENLKIYYVGLLPNMFRDKQGVVAQGKFDQEKNEFFAEELLIKHDENYMPPEVKSSLQH